MRVFALLAAALVACGDSSGPHGFSTGPAPTTLPFTTTSTGEGPGSSTGTSSTGALPDSTGSPPAPDMGPQPDFGSQQPLGCKGKIDFIFVISRDYEMNLYQERLLASFDGFMATIAAEFSGFDTHILVANPDDYWPGDECVKWQCSNAGCENFPCEEYAKYAHTGVFCERTIGAGVLFPARGDATNYECELAGGNRYITSEEPDVTAAFKCLATLGNYGGVPSPAEALVEAVSPELNAPDGCNAGFLRPDALLVVALISDSADVWLQDSKGTPPGWYDAVVAAKGGDPDAVVILSLVPPKPEDPPKPDCLYDYDPPLNRLYEFTEMFPHHVIASVCEDSYVPAFAETTAAVKTACAGFIPQ